MIDRLMRRIYASPWFSASGWVIGFTTFHYQPGWQRWLWFTAGLICLIGFVVQANERWGRRPPRRPLNINIHLHGDMTAQDIDEACRSITEQLKSR